MIKGPSRGLDTSFLALCSLGAQPCPPGPSIPPSLSPLRAFSFIAAEEKVPCPTFSVVKDDPTIQLAVPPPPPAEAITFACKEAPQAGPCANCGQACHWQKSILSQPMARKVGIMSSVESSTQEKESVTDITENSMPQLRKRGQKWGKHTQNLQENG